MRHVVLLAGGQGRRFWPRSRRERPKQFMSFEGGRSLLRATAERLEPVVPAARQWVVTHRDYVDRVLAELPELPARHVVGEPRAVNTAAAVGLAAALLAAEEPGAVMLVQAADHWIRDVARFRELVAAAFAEVEKGRPAVLIGFRPNRPATGYGYIGVGKPLPAPRGMRLHAVASYREKPKAASARRFASSGRYLWNGCLFFWRARTLLDALRASLPQLGSALDRAAGRIARGAPRERVLQTLYRDLEPVSIEHGVVEKMTGLAVLEGDCGWEDVGTWEALAHVFAGDRAGNVVQGNHFGIDTRGSLVLSDAGLVVTLGVSDLIVVKDGDAVLVLPRAREGELRTLVERLEAQGRFRAFL